MDHLTDKETGYIAGFIDGDGCFYASMPYYKKKGQPTYPCFKMCLRITQRADNKRVLQYVKSLLKVGRLFKVKAKKGGRPQALYSIEGKKDLKAIIPILDECNFIVRKEEYQAWRDILEVFLTIGPGGRYATGKNDAKWAMLQGKVEELKGLKEYRGTGPGRGPYRNPRVKESA